MKNKIRSLLTLAAIAAVAVIGTACSSTNTQQFINSTSGDGVLGKIAVPITQSTSIGASLFVGRFNNSVVLQPTSTNGEVHSPNLALVVAGAGKQAVNGSVGNTNSGSAGISDGSRDASIIVTGSAQAESANGTNMTYKISGQ